MTYKKTKVLVSVIYRSASQNSNEFNLFLTHLENLFSDINNRKPFLSVVTGDFNARSSSWWPSDINTSEGTNLFSLASSNGFSQLINEPTHIQTSSSSCLDLIFTDQPNLSINSGVHSSLHSNCHHQIVHSSFNLNIHYLSELCRTIYAIEKQQYASNKPDISNSRTTRVFGFQ